MTQTIPLPSRLDVEAASALWDRIALSEGDLTLDAADLHHLAAAGLQTLLMAQRHQQDSKRNLTLINAGPALATGLNVLGAAQNLPLPSAALSGGKP